jgi:hypothetical protein
MAWFGTEYVSQVGFSRLPHLREDIPEVVQPRGSLQGSETSHASGASSRHVPHMQEGDLITGTIDLTHELAHMLPAIRDSSRAGEKEDMVCVHLSLDDNLTSPIRFHQEQFLISLKIIPPYYRHDWSLDHYSNIILRVSLALYLQRLSNGTFTQYPSISTGTTTTMQLF